VTGNCGLARDPGSAGLTH